MNDREKEDRVKVIAFYLPQFHEFQENNKWWGKGFTEWTTVKNAKPLFEGHNQPRVPLNKNYYNLLDDEVAEWQASLAKQYGIYGFCYYHYWFDGKMLMEKPMEKMLNNKNITLPFCICWANENWTRTWADKSKEILISQTYGNKEDWVNHYNYFSQFFLDNRYIKVEGKPILVIYRPEIIGPLREMLELWNEMAKKDGFPGICFMYQFKNYNHQKDKDGDLFDFGIEYQPVFSRWEYKKSFSFIIQFMVNNISDLLKIKSNRRNVICMDYDKEWKRVLKNKPRDEKMIPGAFTDWDNTPRHKNKGFIYLNANPRKFELYFTEQLKRTEKIYKKDMIFIFAWNEWGEGGYLEPDECYKYGYLEAVKNALEKYKDN